MQYVAITLIYLLNREHRLSHAYVIVRNAGKSANLMSAKFRKCRLNQCMRRLYLDLDNLLARKYAGMHFHKTDDFRKLCDLHS